MPTTELDTFTQAYVEAALWSSTDNANDQGGEPLDANYSADDIAPECLAQMVADCQDFQESFGELVLDDLSRAGHEFWLTRNRHGAGFFDGDWDTPFVETDDNGEPTMVQRYPTVGDHLTDISHAYGSYDLYVGDDGLIYGQ
jgi:hypothetical protein